MRAGALLVVLALATLDPAVGCRAARLQAAGAARATVALDLRPTAGIPATVVALARREARDLWRPAGVELVAEKANAEVVLRVVWSRALPRGGGPRVVSLAGVRFAGRRPEPVIQVWAEAVVAAATSGVAPRVVSEETIGRVLGRVLAHEIGHYLRGAPGHDATGLMRAQHSAFEFVAESRAPFEMEPGAVADLKVRTTASQ